MAADVPIFCGVGGGITQGKRVVNLGLDAEFKGAMGVVVNAPTSNEIVENLMLDPRLQYALHTTSYKEQPLSDKTLSRFRKRCYDYEALYNIDLHHDCIKDLSTSIRKLSAGFDQFDFGCQPAGAWRGGTE